MNNTPESKPKETFAQFVNRITLIAGIASVVVLLNDFPSEINELASKILKYAIILWASLVGLPVGWQILRKHKLKLFGGWVTLRQFISKKEATDNELGMTLPTGNGIGTIPDILSMEDKENQLNKSNGIGAITDNVELAERGNRTIETLGSAAPFSLFPPNPRPFASSPITEDKAAELIFNAVQMAGLRMDELPEILAIDAGPTLQTISFRLPAKLQLSDLVKKRDDLANHIGHDHSFSVTSTRFPSAAAFVVPHVKRAFVYMNDMIKDLMNFSQTAELPMVFGRDMEGKPILVDLAKLPHLLVAGATGSGKSVFINGLITSLAVSRSPQDVQFLLIDPKMVEFVMYTGLPHLISPPVTAPSRAPLALKKLVVEMEKRYKLFSQRGIRNIRQFRKNYPEESMPYIVAVIDEYADLMVIARNDVEDTVQRLTQMGRAAGIHLILGTQRPSVDVVTGVIKSNLPSRVAFHLQSGHDYRTVMDTGGPHLLGGGDGVCMLNGGGQKRFQSAAISADDDETIRFIEGLTQYWLNQSIEVRLVKVDLMDTFEEDESLDEREDTFKDPVNSDLKREALEILNEHLVIGSTHLSAAYEQEPTEQSDLYEQVIRIARKHNGISGRLLQTALDIDYITAATYVERLSKEGKVAQDYDPSSGLKPWQEIKETDDELLVRMQRIIFENGSARSADLQRELGIRKEKVLQMMNRLVQVGFLLPPTSTKGGYTLAWSEEQMHHHLNE